MGPGRRLRPGLHGVLACATAVLTACLPTRLAGPAPPDRPDGGSTAAGPTATPFQPLAPTATPVEIRIWLSPSLPPTLRAGIEALEQRSSGRYVRVEDPNLAHVWAEANAEVPVSRWVYALVAPFPTVRDGMDSPELRSRWAGASTGPLLAADSTAQALSSSLGSPLGVTLVSEAELLDRAWAARPASAVVPFEALEPRWKVLTVDGVSPIHKDFDPAAYPLAVSFGLSGEPWAVAALLEKLDWPATNRDPGRLTVVVMTGVTALTRAVAWRMDARGADYPAQRIGDWLREADVLHVSNEVSFTETCPPPNPVQEELRFCSSPRHLPLLETIGTDLIELTGNHILDWGPGPFLDSLAEYRARGWQYFGGGEDLARALQPVPVEHNGNRLAFFGCNDAGPYWSWARENSPGSLSCDDGRVLPTLEALRAEGFVPVFTFQWAEVYQPTPIPSQAAAFRVAVDAGAVIVQGSQAHAPQSFEFHGGGFIHYGLGNLFFDQMWSLETRQAFIDRHVFYDGRHISTELLTTMMEDFAQPRPMDPAERAAFLQRMFAASGW